MTHDALLDEGWQRQTTIDEPRLSELVENYRGLGYELLVVHADVSHASCNECFKASAAVGHGVGTIYIRRQADVASADDELFSP